MLVDVTQNERPSEEVLVSRLVSSCIWSFACFCNNTFHRIRRGYSIGEARRGLQDELVKDMVQPAPEGHLGNRTYDKSRAKSLIYQTNSLPPDFGAFDLYYHSLPVTIA